MNFNSKNEGCIYGVAGLFVIGLGVSLLGALSQQFPSIINIGLVLGGIISITILLTGVGWLIRHFIKDPEILKSLFYGFVMFILALIVYKIIS